MTKLRTLGQLRNRSVASSPARHTSQKFPQTGEIIDLGNISQPGENLLTGHRLLWFKLGEYLPI